MRHQMRRLMNHPSIVLWCGNNENQTAVDVWWREDPQVARMRKAYDKLTFGVQERVVLDEDPGRPWWSSSPAGYPRERASAPDGAVLLTMFYGEPRAAAGAGSDYDPKLLVEYVDPLTMDWDPDLVDPQLAKGVAIKPLRTDPYTGEVSFLYCSPPHRVPPGMAKPQWTHPMVEELYVLEGEYVWGDLGRMRRGGYAWWRENVYHGPAGTDTGYNLFVRTIGGPLVNVFATEKKPFTWRPEHRPALPDELKPYGQPLALPPNY